MFLNLITISIHYKYICKRLKMVSIYCIEDCDGLNYVGSTIQTLSKRFNEHKSRKKTGKTCSSRQLNLDNCKIYELERCSAEDRFDREKYHINTIDCVNTNKLNCDKKQYYQDNKEALKIYKKEHYQKNKEAKLKYQREHYQKNREAISKRKKESYLRLKGTQ